MGQNRNIGFDQHKLNAAFKTGDRKKICTAISTLIHETGNVKAFALKAGVERGMLYRSFQHNPRFNLVLKVLSPADFQLQAIDHPKIFLSRSARSRQLCDALETREIAVIVDALGKILRDQDNVTSFAQCTNYRRASLYRAFTPPHIPSLGIVLSFLNALDLRLVVTNR
jgi:DNA-binding phage protein